MEKAELLFLIDYMDWAREHMLDAVAGLTTEERERELGGSFGSVQKTLVHLVWAEETWSNRLQVTSPPLAEPVALADLADLRSVWAAIAARTRQWVAALPDGPVTGSVEYTHRTGGQYATRADVLIQHLSNHQTYHRGQVAHMLRQLGHPAVSTDMIYYHRERNP